MLANNAQHRNHRIHAIILANKMATYLRGYNLSYLPLCLYVLFGAIVNVYIMQVFTVKEKFYRYKIKKMNKHDPNL